MNTTATLRTRIFRLTRPIFFETLLIMSLGTIDTFMLSQISDASVAAVGLVNQVLMMIFLVFTVGASGCLVVCSQYLGAQRLGDFLETAKVSLAVNTLLGILVSAGLALFADDLLTALMIQPELRADARSYCEIVGGCAFLVAINFAATSVLRAREMTAYPMYVSLLTNIVNVIANYALIFGHFGFSPMYVEGAAWATVASRVAGLLLLLLFLIRKGLTRDKASGKPFEKLRQILRIGIPGAGEMFSYAASQVTITACINFLGTEALAARTYIANIVIVTFIFAISLAQGGSILAGHLVGKHKYRAAKAIGEFAIRRALTISASLSLLVAMFAPFGLPLLTDNPNILSLCASILWIDLALECGRAVNILTGRLLAAVGDPLLPLKVSIVVVWSVATAGGYLVGIVLGCGLIGMWSMFTVDECLRAFVQWRYWRREGWMHKSIC